MSLDQERSWEAQKQRIRDWARSGNHSPGISCFDGLEPFTIQPQVPEGWPHIIWIMDYCSDTSEQFTNEIIVEARFALPIYISLAFENRKPVVRINFGLLSVRPDAELSMVKDPIEHLHTMSPGVLLYHLYTRLGYTDLPYGDTELLRNIDHMLGAIEGVKMRVPSLVLEQIAH